MDSIYLFGPFRLNVAARQLLAGDVPVGVHGKAFDVLVALVRRRGECATRQQLLDEAWPSTIVEENNVNTQVLNLRTLLRAHDPATAYIITDARRGYRFAAAVTVPVPPAAARDPPPEAGRRPHNLPAESNSFVGRTLEMAEIAERLHTGAVLTLVGSGGMGKTRCAIRLGHAAGASFADGVWLVELAPMLDGSLVAEAVCRAVGAPVSRDRPALEVAAAFLRKRNLLLVLDNCEHVLDASAQLAASLVRECPGVRILATSRQALGIDGEMVFRMPPLKLPPAGAIDATSAMRSDAVRLFVDRADSASGGYELTEEDAAPVVTICRRLDGVPMAMELAAARLRMLKPAEIAARLEDVFQLLTNGGKEAPPRQQTLRAAIDWSFDLLSVQEQILLRSLAVYVDGFSLAGAVAVQSDGAANTYEVLDLLTALVDKSLVNVDKSGAVTRYRMLETTRQYAREKLDESGDTGQSRRAAAYLAKFFARAETTWPVTPTQAWLAEFGCEVENLRAAIDWAFGQERVFQEGSFQDGSFQDGSLRDRVTPPATGDRGDPDLGMALVATAGSIAEEMSLQADLKRWTKAALAKLSPETPPGIEAWVMYWAVRHQSIFGVREVSAVRRRMIDLFRQAEDRVGLSCALRTTGIAIAGPDNPDGEALAMLTEAADLLRPVAPTKDLATVLAHLGSFHYFNGKDSLAQAYSDEALEMRRLLGDRTGIAISFMNMGEYSFVRRDVAQAIAYATNAVAQARQCHLLEILGISLSNLSNYLLSVDDLAGGRAAACEAVALLRALGNHDHAILCLENLALERALAHEHQAAARIFGYTDAHFKKTGQQREPSERLRCERLWAELEAGLPAEMIAACMEQGAGWTADMADAAALRAQPPLPAPLRKPQVL